MNDDLRNGGKYYDGSKNGSGSRYLWQDDHGVLPKKGLWHGPNGDHVVAGATADFIKVTWTNGKIVSVDTWDANESNAREFHAGNTADTVARKMDGRRLTMAGPERRRYFNDYLDTLRADAYVVRVLYHG
ncbi:hypothetical protein OG426_32580 [Streptomyces canus]|uniref:hypothetical protein n=1 Tax=Streptomyces canus TaxID=58343 RepID=UPI0022586011|nr:hypothetical protein [Streptomyces canus]MCX4857825.1 hypothetical protein [Streptomyces canus]WSW36849.1 hypothetical protein OG426_32580 [Streptomyces canus]